MDEANRVELTGRLIELGALRHTPAGIPVIEFRMRHDSETTEAGARRKVSAEVEAVAFENQARLVASSALERAVRVNGFLCARTKRSKKLVLHVTNIEFVEGD